VRNDVTVTRLDLMPYNKRWPTEFHQLGADLREALAGLALRIDHIGSASVPGLAAKDVIDIQVAVASLDPEPLVQKFRSVGYEHLALIDRDHIPPWTRASDQWRKLLFQRRAPQRRANVHVRAADPANTRYALLFRDYLRAHPRAAGAYADLKRKLAALEPPLPIGDTPNSKTQPVTSSSPQLTTGRLKQAGSRVKVMPDAQRDRVTSERRRRAAVAWQLSRRNLTCVVCCENRQRPAGTRRVEQLGQARTLADTHDTA
jgi:GrpB-like predicted nucleotidyltransferase (UPF0157 family)